MKTLAILLISFCTISAQLEITEAFPNISIPQITEIKHAGDGSNRLFVLSQEGKIFVFPNDRDVTEAKEFLDIESKVLFGGEQGLLGLAFHPEYEKNGIFFINYTTDDPRRTIVSRWKTSTSDPDVADPGSEVILLEVNQPYANHNGGVINFGPDGYLYISFGDGGSAGDPQNNGQNRKTFLGSIIRIDVDNPSGGKNYGIPDDNPFTGNNQGFLEEIYAYGLRNVWKFSFDERTGKIFAADVGQNKWEEIDIIEKGKNYGWRIMEGNHCYNPEQNCDQSGLVLPIHEYDHSAEGGYSVTGGYMYYGKAAPSLFEKYIFADFVNGNIWALNDFSGKYRSERLFDSNYSVSTFGLDENGELYFASYSSGKIYTFRDKK